MRPIRRAWPCCVPALNTNRSARVACCWVRCRRPLSRRRHSCCCKRNTCDHFMRIQQWRAFRGIFAREGAWMLEFDILLLPDRTVRQAIPPRSEEHTSELQSHSDLVCRLLLEKKKRFSSSSG